MACVLIDLKRVRKKMNAEIHNIHAIKYWTETMKYKPLLLSDFLEEGIG